MSKIITPEEACRMPRDQQGYVPVWVEYLPLNNGTSQIFAGYVDANSLLGNSVSFISSKPQSYFQKGDQIRFWDSYPTEQERDTALWGGGKNRNGNNP